MVGNDVVDLRDPDADASTLHPNFDLRAFAEPERASLVDCADAGRERWAMWAAKEAAYKLARRLGGGAAVNPTDDTRRPVKYLSEVIENATVVGTTHKHMLVSSAVPDPSAPRA